MLILNCTTTIGQGWPQEENGLYLKLGQWWVNYDEFYDENGEAQGLGRTRSFGNTSIYAEYGITKNLTAIVYFPFFSKATIYKQVNAFTGNVIQEGEQLSSLGDSDLTVKYSWPIFDQIYISSSITLGFPLGNFPEDDFQSTNTLQTGDGEFNQMLTLGGASSFNVGRYFPYISLSGSFNNRTEGYSDEWRFLFETGINIRSFTFIIKVDGIESLQNGALNNNLVGGNLIGNNTEYLRISPEIGWGFTDQFGLSLSLFETLSGQLIFSETSYAIGIYWKK